MKTGKPERRKVSKKGNLRIGGKTYPVGDLLANQTVGIVLTEKGVIGIWCDTNRKPYTNKALDRKDGQWCRLLTQKERAEQEKKQKEPEVI